MRGGEGSEVVGREGKGKYRLGDEEELWKDWSSYIFFPYFSRAPRLEIGSFYTVRIFYFTSLGIMLFFPRFKKSK